MPKQEVPLHRLQDYLPPGTYDAVSDYLQQYRVHLTISRERKSILGDYRHRTGMANHRISVNGNLNTYAFLITLLHELAHLLAFEQFGNRIAAHGTEWKKVYAALLKQFLEQRLFPSDIQEEIIRSLQNPAASSCAEEGLMRVLRKYDNKDTSLPLVEELPAGAMFRTSDGRVFQKMEKMRKRFKCVEVKTGKVYLFSPVYEVQPLAAG